MFKICKACGFDNPKTEDSVCPKCEKYYIKTDKLSQPNNITTPSPKEKPDTEVTVGMKRSFSISLSQKQVTAAALCVGLVIGFFSGREYFKYELKQVMVSAFSPMSLAPNKYVTKKTVSNHVSSEDNISRHTTCSTVSELANVIVTQRQNGADMSTLINAGISTDSGDESVNARALEMIQSAYDSPRYSTESVKQRVISEFKNKYYAQCHSSFRVTSR